MYAKHRTTRPAEARAVGRVVSRAIDSMPRHAEAAAAPTEKSASAHMAMSVKMNDATGRISAASATFAASECDCAPRAAAHELTVTRGATVE